MQSKELDHTRAVEILIRSVLVCQRRGGIKKLNDAAILAKLIKYLQKVEGYENIIKNEMEALEAIGKYLETAQAFGALELEEAEHIISAVLYLREEYNKKNSSEEQEEKIKEI